MALESLLGIVVFLVVWAAACSATKSALRSFFGRHHYRDSDDSRTDDADR